MDKATSNREQYIDKFCRHLDKDITELGHDVKEIKNDSQVSRQECISHNYENTFHFLVS